MGALDFCTCAAACGICKNDAAGTEEAPVADADVCFTCAGETDVLTEEVEGEGGSCAAAEGDGDGEEGEEDVGLNGGKAGLGEVCDSDGANHGCADGNRCAGDADLGEFCILSELC